MHSKANKRRNLRESANFEQVGFSVLYLKNMAVKFSLPMIKEISYFQ